MAKWDGIYALEKAIVPVRNMLVYVWLDGIKGVSSPVPGYEHKLLPKADALRYLEKGQTLIARLGEQKAPRGQATRWLDHHRNDLVRIYNGATAVWKGGKQKMDAKAYGELYKSLGLAPRY